MSRFNEGGKPIIYNNRDIYQYFGLKVIDFEPYVLDDFGVKRSVTFNNNILVDVKDERFNIKITFVRTKLSNINLKNKRIIGLDNNFLQEVSRVFFGKKDVNTLRYGDLFYYVIPVSGTIQKLDDIGHFSIEFESCSPYCYSNIYTKAVTVSAINSPKVIELNNNGINNVYYEVEFICLESGTLTISNLGKSITIKNQSVGKEVNIIGDTLEFLGIEPSNIEGDLSTALKLIYGTNRITIKTDGKFKMIFSYQAEYALT